MNRALGLPSVFAVIHGYTLKSFLGNCSCIALLSDIRVTKTIFSIRPAWMQEVQITHGEVICHSIDGDNRTAIHGSLRNMTTRDGGSADIAGANIYPSMEIH